MQEWISVNDRLPVTENYVLVCTQSKNGSRNIDKGYFLPGPFRWACRGTAEVTHWMPMPEPPGASVKVESLVKKYDKEETIEGCTVQILTHTKTGETSVGWWRGTKEDMPGMANDGNH